MTRSEYIVNVDGLEWSHEEHGDRFEFHRKWLSAPTGAQKLGCSLYRIPPGKTGFPFHKHFSNEEAIYVIAGEGILRLEGESFSVAFVPEGPNHQLLNSGTTDLEYLCISTMIHPDITLFPDSDKVIAFAGSGPGGDKSMRTFNGIFKRDSAVGYYDGE